MTLLLTLLSTSPSCPKQLEEAAKEAKCFSDVFETIRPLSCQASCFVTLCTVRASGKQVVVKTYLKHKLGATATLQVQKEIQIHSSLSHPNIVNLLLSFEDYRSIYLVVALADKGDLRQNMLTMTERWARDVLAVPILRVLEDFHKKGIVHRDLKPENVLVGADNQVMVADFGLSMYSSAGQETGPSCRPSPEDHIRGDPDDAEARSQAVEDSTEEASPSLEELAASCSRLADSAAGTPLYTPPEVLSLMFRNQPMQPAVQPKNDVWALGIMLLEAITGFHPFNPDPCGRAHGGNVMYNIANLKSVTLPMHLSPELTDFLTVALKRNPEERASASELLQHPWMSIPLRGAKAGSMSSLHLPSSCTPSSRSSDIGELGLPDDSSDEMPLSCCARLEEANDFGSLSCRRPFAAFDCWED